MKIAIINNDQVVSVGNYLELFPNTSFPESGLNDSFMQEQSLLYVSESIPYDSEVEKLVPCTPYIDGSVVVIVRKEPLTTEELNTLQVNKKEAFKKLCMNNIQARLDSFAQTRNYYDIKSASDYAGCIVPSFSAEGIYCRDLRALTWEKAYSILNEVESNIRPMPSTYAEIEAELPPLAWPS